MARYGNGNKLTSKILIKCRRCRSKTVQWDMIDGQKICIKCINKEKMKNREPIITEVDLEYRDLLRKHKNII